MQNVYNEDSPSNSKFTRTFKIDKHITSLFAHSNVVQASFFDLYDNGYLDILLVTRDEQQQQQQENYHLIALKNEYYDDVYFLKVMVIPGRCSVGSSGSSSSNSRCPFNSLPYGLNYPGAMIKIETQSYEYQRVVAYAGQLTQSSHMSLQLPYVIFGLGTTPNFVEYLTVAILATTTNNRIQGYRKEWHQIIPNSQLVISPFPRDYTYKSVCLFCLCLICHSININQIFYFLIKILLNKNKSWKMQLFITPSKNILMTVISLGITMICLVVVIGILQFREWVCVCLVCNSYFYLYLRKNLFIFDF